MIKKIIKILIIIIALIFIFVRIGSTPKNIWIRPGTKLTFHDKVFDCGDGIKNSIGCYWNDEIQIISKDKFPDGYGGFERVLAHEVYHSLNNPGAPENETEEYAWKYADSIIRMG